MQAGLIILGLAAIAAIVYAGGTARAAYNLEYKFEGMKVHKITLNGVKLKLIMKIVNMTDTPLVVELASLTAYLNPTYTVDKNGKTTIVTPGSEFAQINYNEPFTIAASKIANKDIMVDITWAKLGLAIRNNLQTILTPGGKATILIKGQIKCKGIIIPVEYITTLTY